MGFLASQQHSRVLVCLWAFGQRYLLNKWTFITFSNYSCENFTDETMGSGLISDHKYGFRDVIHSSMICLKHCKGKKIKLNVRNHWERNRK